MEVHMGQIANFLNSKQPNALPYDIERNPRQHLKVITLMNGKDLNEPKAKKKNKDKKSVVEKEQNMEV